jgi:hypothetical protein
MTSRLATAMEEAYASAPSDVIILHTMELNHPAFAEPVRVVTGEEPIGDGPVLLTLETGVEVAFTPLAFDVTPPGFDDDGPTSGKLGIDMVSGLLFDHLVAAASSAGVIDVTYRGYRSDVRFEPGDVITGLKLRAVTLTATRAEGEIGFDEVGRQAFPRRTYTIDQYPGLFRA